MIDVCAAVIVNPKEKLVFLAKRPENSHLAGFWEFPGGKMEKGESPKECLVRELKEELDVSARVGSFICESVYHYSEKTVRLLAYWVMIAEKPKLKEHDSFMWVRVDEFDFISNGTWRYGRCNEDTRMSILLFRSYYRRDILQETS